MQIFLLVIPWLVKALLDIEEPKRGTLLSCRAQLNICFYYLWSTYWYPEHPSLPASHTLNIFHRLQAVDGYVITTYMVPPTPEDNNMYLEVKVTAYDTRSSEDLAEINRDFSLRRKLTLAAIQKLTPGAQILSHSAVRKESARSPYDWRIRCRPGEIWGNEDGIKRGECIKSPETSSEVRRHRSECITARITKAASFVVGLAKSMSMSERAKPPMLILQQKSIVRKPEVSRTTRFNSLESNTYVAAPEPRTGSMWTACLQGIQTNDVSLTIDIVPQGVDMSDRSNQAEHPV